MIRIYNFMKSYYVYLVTIEHPKGKFYYVGSHSWEGPEGQLDPTYHGSSSYRYYTKWLDLYPFKEEILEVSDKDSIYKAEKRWILYYLRTKGSFLKTLPDRNSSWLRQFKYGFCLNGHANTAEQIHTEESYQKVSEWRRLNREKVSQIVKSVKDKAGREKLSEASRKAMNTMGKEGLKRRTATRLRNMGTDGCSELVKHAAITRGSSYKESAVKGVCTRSGSQTKMRIVFMNGILYDSIVAACVAAGHKTWNSMISQHFCKGESRVVRYDNGKEFVFEIAEVKSVKEYGILK